MYIVLSNALSFFLFPFLDRLLGHDPGSVEGGIKADVLVDGTSGVWLLQDPPSRDWNTVTDELDCFNLNLRFDVVRIQFDTILIAEISMSGIQVFAKRRFCMRADMGDDMLPYKFSLLYADFLFNPHNISHLEWKSGGPPRMFSLMIRWDLERDF